MRNSDFNENPCLKKIKMKIKYWRINDILEGKIPKVMPSLYWTSEIYSFGRCYRAMISNKFLPVLPFYSDHGVHPITKPAKHEMEAGAGIHVLWSTERERGFSLFGKKIIRVCHPYVYYAQKKYKKKINEKAGTLVFYAHSTSDIKYEKAQNLDKYIDSLIVEGFPAPFYICIHMWDVINDKVDILNRTDCSFVCAGNTMSPYFVDRLFDIIDKCSVSVSNTMGSHSFISEYLGTPFRLYGNEPVYINISDDNIPLGRYNVYDQVDLSEVYLALKTLFQMPHDFFKSEKKELVNAILGVDRLAFVYEGNFRFTLLEVLCAFGKLVVSRFMSRR